MKYYLHLLLLSLSFFARPQQTTAQSCQAVPNIVLPSNIAPIACQANSISNGQNINNGDLEFLNGTNVNNLTINNGGTAVFCGNASVLNNLNMNGNSRLHINGTSVLPGGGGLSNNAVIAVQNGGTLTSARSNYNGATIVVRSGGTLNLNANFENLTVIIESGGTVNLNASAFNQNVTLVVNAGATLNINNDLALNQNTQIINYGIINTTRNITLQGNPSRIFNATNSARFNMGNLTINSGGRLVNYGGVSTNELTINGGDGGQSICMSANSAVSVQRVNANNLANSVQAPQGAACFRIRGTAANQFNQVLTNSSGLTVCTPTGMAPSTGGAASNNNGFGSATVVPNCNDNTLCDSILPVTWVSFDAQRQEDDCVLLTWSTVMEISNSGFDILRSLDGEIFENIGNLPGAGFSNGLQTYTFTDCFSAPSVAYYRVRQNDFDGTSSYSRIVAVTPPTYSAAWESALTDGKLRITTYQNVNRLEIILTDISGRVLHRQDVELPAGTHLFDVPTFGGNVYLLHIQSAERQFMHKFFVIP